MGCKQRKQTNRLDATTDVAAPIAPNADALGHRQCGSYAPQTPEISSKIGWGGTRPNSGGARPNSGGARPGAGRKPKVLNPRGAALANERIAASIGSLDRPASEGARWYCVAVLPRMETVALGELVKQDFTAWAPRFEQPGADLPSRRLPLFPGYVFVRFSLTYDPWWQINGTPGVRGLFPVAAERPWPLPTWQMDRLFADCDSEGLYTKIPVETQAALDLGSNVRIQDGPFTNFVGIVRAVEPDTVKVEITIFGRATDVWYPRGMVAPA